MNMHGMIITIYDHVTMLEGKPLLYNDQEKSAKLSPVSNGKRRAHVHFFYMINTDGNKINIVWI
jgi:hypothetical protein